MKNDTKNINDKSYWIKLFTFLPPTLYLNAFDLGFVKTGCLRDTYIFIREGVMESSCISLSLSLMAVRLFVCPPPLYDLQKMK